MAFSLAHRAGMACKSFVRLPCSILPWVLLVLFAWAQAAAAFDVSYWVWQRADPLNDEELARVAAQGVRTLYWHVGELENKAATWRWIARFSLPTDTAALHFVPVVRLVSREPEPFGAPSTAALVSILASASKKTQELQIDYDAPDRLLPDYARVLTQIHALSPHLSITALPGWSRAESLRTLGGSVDEFFPMLYDFAAEPTLSNGSPRPLLLPKEMKDLLRSWSACPKPWHAGLPAFARLTVYDENGKSRGQIRNWNWDEVSLNRALQTVSDPRFGASLCRVLTACALSNTRLQANDQLAVRLTDRTALHDAIAQAHQTTARGVVLFRLPDSSASSGWSLPQLAHLDEKPRLVFRPGTAHDSFVLENAGEADLEPLLPPKEGERRGYAVEVATDTPIFREAEPGDFAFVTTWKEGSKSNRRVALPFATRVSFTFSQLRAGQSLQTGLIQLAPGASFRQARYRFQNSEEAWKPLD